MKSIKFPDMLKYVTTNIVTDHDATMSNLKLLLLSDRGSLLGDPYFGTNLKRLMFDQNNYVLRDVVIDDIYTAILQFLPQILVKRKDITINADKTRVQINIKAQNMLDYTLDTYNLVLLSEDITQ